MKISFHSPLPALLAGASFFALAGSLVAQERSLKVEPSQLELKIGQSAQLHPQVLDGAGNPEEVQLLFFSLGRGSISVDKDGRVKAFQAGDFSVRVRTTDALSERLSVTIPVHVVPAEIFSLEFLEAPERLFEGAREEVALRIVDEFGKERPDLKPELSSSDPSVARLDPYGRLVAVAPGVAILEATCRGVRQVRQVRVEANPVHSLSLKLVTSGMHAAAAGTIRTGDVLQFETQALDADGAPLENIPIQYSVFADTEDNLGQSASGQVDPSGRFVAETPGLYTIHASSGERHAQHTVQIKARNVQRKIQLIGRGKVHDVHTSDLWVWEGQDGRDYAVTGTWGADGETRFWDVTDPSKMEEIAGITVDARTVNDVKISADGSLCVISREGASTRKNGIVIIDVKDPRNPEILSTYTENLTGGVHNVFIYQDHVFALSAGQWYDIINIEDPRKPYTVSHFELDVPSPSIHDVWVEDGIAYSSNWRDGLYMVDVGNGVKGGTLAKPVIIGHYAYPSGWNHAAFPYHDKLTGKFYIVAGDEAFPYGLSVDDNPTYPRGWLHFVDFTDPLNPKEVARYQVPEAGSHNFWIEDDVLYAAFYNGGLRVVDLSGDLMGDLYKQGREMAWFLPTDKDGRVANAPMVWGPQPHKGKIFFSDWNTGLWAVEMEKQQ